MNIVLHSLSFSYGENMILKDIDLSIKDDGLYPLVGLNGEGKTTLCKLIMGLLRPQSGQILVGGKKPWTLRPGERAKLFSYLPQEGSFSPGLTVKELLSMSFFHLNCRYWKINLAKEGAGVIEDFSLTPLLDSLYDNLSGGQKRKVLLASCLLQKAPVVVLDEPFSFLDPKKKREIGGLIEGVVGRKVLVVCHDVSFIERHLPRTLGLKNKRLKTWEGKGKGFLEEVYK